MVPFPEYPRPMMQRTSFVNLNGIWQYAFTEEASLPKEWHGDILVPYSPETKASGVQRTLQPNEWLHYSRTFAAPAANGGHVLLHFGAVDCDCLVEVNHCEVGRHTGGYWPFTFDITDYLHEGNENILHVAVQDPSDTGIQARGKQKLQQGGMFYPAQSGIWQTVWLEHVPNCYVHHISCETDVENNTVSIMVETNADSTVRADILFEKQLVASAASETDGKHCIMRVVLPKAHMHLWAPNHPNLYDVIIHLGEDMVLSYFAMREWTCERDAHGIMRFCLNHQPIFMNGLLDQGYWQDGLYTPPSDEAVIEELKLVKSLGFNMLRKHAKIEPQRWYYHCDRLGLIVWQDCVSGGTKMQSWYVTYLANLLLPVLRHFPDHGLFRYLLSRPNSESRTLFRREMADTIMTLKSHPSIAMWIPFNEGWGQFNASSITKELHNMDNTRLIDQASGWFDQGGGDVYSIHNYFYKLRIRKKSRVVALTEYGGIAWPMPGHLTHEKTYGYGTAGNRETLTARYCVLQMDTILPQLEKGLSALVYTQLSDVEEEVNGIRTYDRLEIKPDADAVRKTNAALTAEFDRCSQCCE